MLVRNPAIFNVSSFNPAILALSLWARASYSGSPWAGTASAGASGSNSLTEATNPPTVGTAQNGLTPAQFNGTSNLISASGTSFVSTSAGSVAILYNADTSAAAGTVSNDPHLLSDGGATDYYAIGHNSTGPRVYVFDGAYKSLQLTGSTGSYHLVQMKWDGVNLYGRVDSGSWTSVATSGPSVINAPVFGVSSVSTFFNGKIAEIMMANSVLADSVFDQIKGYLNNRYALSL